MAKANSPERLAVSTFWSTPEGQVHWPNDDDLGRAPAASIIGGSISINSQSSSRILGDCFSLMVVASIGKTSFFSIL